MFLLRSWASCMQTTTEIWKWTDEEVECCDGLQRHVLKLFMDVGARLGIIQRIAGTDSAQVRLTYLHSTSF